MCSFSYLLANKKIILIFQKCVSFNNSLYLIKTIFFIKYKNNIS